MKTALTIAGSDSCGGAGIQADIKTMIAHGVYAMSAVTAVTAQNTCGVKRVMEVSDEILAEQLTCVFQDIFPDAVKIGMMASASKVGIIAAQLSHFQARHVVLDPVMVSTSGTKLMSEEAIVRMKQQLLPLVEVVTPNVPETEILSGQKIHTAADLVSAARKISTRYGCQVLCKGGHLEADAEASDDLLYLADTCKWFRGKRIDNPNTHGTGCTLSSAIASNLALGYELEEAVRRAKEYLTGAIAAGLDLGSGRGPMNHGYVFMP